MLDYYVKTRAANESKCGVSGGGGAMGAAASPYRLAGEGKLNFTGKSERTQALTEESLARRQHMAPPQLDEICDAAHYLK